MKKLSFKLVMPDVQPVLEGPRPDEVCVPLLAGHKVLVKKKDEVYVGTRIAEHQDPRRGDAHATIDGVVTNVTPTGVTIKKQEVTNPIAERPTPIDLKALEGLELAAALKSLGLGLREFRRKGDHIIINGLNPEPGIRWAGGIYQKCLSELRDAIEVVRKLASPSQISMVVPEGSQINMGPNVRHFYTKPVYPNSLPQLVVKTVTKKENPKGVSVLSLHSLWRYARVIKSGLPALGTVMTVQGKNYSVLAGTKIRTLLDHAGVTPNDGDYVILGGYMRGTAISDLDSCAASYSYGLFHVKKDEFTPVHENPCINCGACVQYCPAHLMPNLISQNAEFQNYDECERLHIKACMDCGLCSYFCISRRPMLQYMREAKKTIAASAKLKMQNS